MNYVINQPKNKRTNRSHRSNDNGTSPVFVTYKRSIHCNFVSELDLTSHNNLTPSENKRLSTPAGKLQTDGYRWSSRLHG